MTKLQLEYWQLRWKIRYESVQQELERNKQAETARHNLAEEAETRRANLAKERLNIKQLEKDWAYLSEQQRATNLNLLLNYAEHRRKRDEFVQNHKIAEQEFELSVREEAHDYELGKKKNEIEIFKNGFFSGLAKKFGIWLEESGTLKSLPETVASIFEQYSPTIETKTKEIVEEKIKPWNDKLPKIDSPVKQSDKPKRTDGNSRKDDYVMAMSNTQRGENRSQSHSQSNVIYSPGTYGPGIKAPGTSKINGNQAPKSVESTGPSSGSSVIYSKGTKPSNYGPGII